MRRSTIRSLAAVVMILGSGLAAHAAINASATYVGTQPSPGVYEYSLTLQNTGTTNISTLWFGWVVYPPIYDLLPSLPTVTSSPAGWSGAGLNDSIYGGYSAEWTTTTSPLGPGQSISGFVFDSPDSPSVMSSTSPVFPLFRADTSWVYIGPSQGDPGLRFQPTQFLPEPTAAAMILAASGMCAGRRRRQR